MRPSKEFIEWFNLVMNYCDATQAEADYEKERIKANYDQAYASYEDMARGIRACIQQ